MWPAIRRPGYYAQQNAGAWLRLKQTDLIPGKGQFR
jgi:hypothetical protein